MSTAVRGTPPYEGGGGVGGKFKKKPFRRQQTTPYDRPLTAFRNSGINNSSYGWLSRLVDPASRLITAGAYRLFDSVFRKRLPSPPRQQQEAQDFSERKQESIDKLHKLVSDDPSAAQGAIGEDEHSRNFDHNNIMELEQILKQKTFTRSEIERLTALLHSKSADMALIKENGFLEDHGKKVAAQDPKKGPANCLVFENEAYGNGLVGICSTPTDNPGVFGDDRASPAELAKAYMGNQSLKVSPSVVGLRSRAFRHDEPLPNYTPFTSKSPGISHVAKSPISAGVFENGFVTPRPRGRTAIYSMARTPYSRTRLASHGKVTGIETEACDWRSTFSQNRQDQNELFQSKQMGLKRRSSVLDNDIGTVGSVRRIRQKPNLLTSTSLGLTFSGSPRSISGAAQDSTSPMHNGDKSIPGTSFTAVPSQSSELAQRILQHLDKLVSPREKSSEHKLAIARDKLPTNLTSDMLSGQALRSLENVADVKLSKNNMDNKMDSSEHSCLLDARDSISQKQLNAGKNVSIPTTMTNPPEPSISLANGVADIGTTIRARTSNSTAQLFAPSSGKKQAFHMSAHEDYLDVDDDSSPIMAAPTPVIEGRETLDSLLKSKPGDAVEAPVRVKPLTITESKGPDISAKEQCLDNADMPVVNQSTKFTFSAITASSVIPQPAVLVPQSASGIDGVSQSVKQPNALASIVSFATQNMGSVSPPTGTSSPQLGASSNLKRVPLTSLRTESFTCLETVASDPANPVISSESDKADSNNPKGGAFFRKPEIALFSAPSTSSSGLFSFVSTASNENPNNGVYSSSPFTCPLPSPSSGSTASVTSSCSALTGVTTNALNATGCSSLFTLSTVTTSTSSSGPSLASAPVPPFLGGGNSFSSSFAVPSLPSSSLSASPAMPSSSTPPAFKCESSVSFSNLMSPASGIPNTGSEAAAEVKNNQPATFSTSPLGGFSASVASTGSSSSGLSNSIPSASDKQSGSSLFGTATGSDVTAQASPSMPISAFGSGTAAAVPETSLFGSSAPAGKLLSSESTFGMTPASASSEANSQGGSGTPINIFGSSWKPSTTLSAGFSFGGTGTSSSASDDSTTPSTGFSFGLSSSPALFNSNNNAVATQAGGFTFGGASSSNAPSTTLFTFGASSAPPVASISMPAVFGSSTVAGATAGSLFSFASAAANTSAASLSSTQAVFANPNSMFTFGQTPPSNNGNGDQMNEDSMAEDSIQASTPTAPVFSQPNISSSPGFMFGAATQSGASPFQFGTQHNQTAPQVASPFQASGGSLEFNGGGSFSLGAGGGDKSNRKIIKVKNRLRKK